MFVFILNAPSLVNKTKPSRNNNDNGSPISSSCSTTFTAGYEIVNTNKFFCLSKESAKDTSIPKAEPKRKRGAPLAKPITRIASEEDKYLTKYFQLNNKQYHGITSTSSSTSRNSPSNITNTSKYRKSTVSETLPTTMELSTSNTLTNTMNNLSMNKDTTTNNTNQIRVRNNTNSNRKRPLDTNETITTTTTTTITTNSINTSIPISTNDISTSTTIHKRSRSNSLTPPIVEGKYNSIMDAHTLYIPPTMNTVDNNINYDINTLPLFADKISLKGDAISPLIKPMPSPSLIPNELSIITNNNNHYHNTKINNNSKENCSYSMFLLNDTSIQRPRGDSNNSIDSSFTNSNENLILTNFDMFNMDHLVRTSSIPLPQASNFQFIGLAKSDSLDGLTRSISGPPGNDNMIN